MKDVGLSKTKPWWLFGSRGQENESNPDTLSLTSQSTPTTKVELTVDSTIDWKGYLKTLAVGAMIGFATGGFFMNVAYTERLIEDCAVMKQFRIGQLAYECKVK